MTDADREVEAWRHLIGHADEGVRLHATHLYELSRVLVGRMTRLQVTAVASLAAKDDLIRVLAARVQVQSELLAKRASKPAEAGGT